MVATAIVLKAPVSISAAFPSSYMIWPSSFIVRLPRRKHVTRLPRKDQSCDQSRGYDLYVQARSRSAHDLCWLEPEPPSEKVSGHANPRSYVTVYKSRVLTSSLVAPAP